MTDTTEYTCAFFFKVTGDAALQAVAADTEHLAQVHRSYITLAVEENKTGKKRLIFTDARKLVHVLPQLKVFKNNKWEDA